MKELPAIATRVVFAAWAWPDGLWVPGLSPVLLSVPFMASKIKPYEVNANESVVLSPLNPNAVRPPMELMTGSLPQANAHIDQFISSAIQHLNQIPLMRFLSLDISNIFFPARSIISSFVFA